MAETQEIAVLKAPPATLAGKGARTIQSVDRALDLIDALAESSGELSLGDLAKRTGLNPSTCHHLLATLTRRGYVGRVPYSRSYCLGPRVTTLSQQRSKQFSIADLAMPELERLGETTRESVHLAVLQGHALVTLAMLDSRLPIRVASDGVTKAHAAHATATGKAILAWLPEPEIVRVLAETGLQGFTDKTCTSISDLMEELRLVRRRGYSVDDEEFQPGVLCIGAAVRDHTGAVIASISCSMPAMRASGENRKAVIAAVKRCATAISERLGSPEAGPVQEP